MTELQQLQWVKINLQAPILAAIPNTIYTEDWLAAIACRETQGIIAKQTDIPDWTKFKGDFTKRPADAQAVYHGFSPWQIDIASFPDFVNSGDWQDPFKSAAKAVSVLEGKRRYISSHVQLGDEMLRRAICASFNCGEGNVIKTLGAKQDIDYKTANHNYSSEVWRLRALYKSLP